MKFFQSLFLLTCLSTLTFMTSCNDDEPAPVQPSLIGTWNLTGLDYTGTSTTESQGFSVTADYTGTGKNFSTQIVFTENPNNYISSGEYSIDLEATTNGITQNITWDSQQFIQSGTWVQNGNTLSVTTNGETQDATIVQLDATNLVMEWNFTRITSAQGATNTQNLGGTYTFTRQ